jgi:peptidoglycan/LPS O-acetylase OafA/YrhL
VVEPRRRLAFLESLRGGAAVYVMLYHLALLPSPALRVPVWAASVILTGGTGVTLFFIASAFSLCCAARPGEDRGRGLAAFALRRFFRIAPLFYAVLAASLVRDEWVFGVTHNLAETLANLMFVFNLWPGHQDGIVWASWTIGVEVLFYAAFPFILVRAATISRAAIGALLMLLVALALPSQGQHSVIHNLPIFVAGILTYRIFERLTHPHRAIGAALIIGALSLYAVMLRGALGRDPYYWQTVVYGAIVLGLAIYPTRMIVNRATLYLGRISYSFYLLHPTIVYALIPFYRRVEAQGWLPTISFGICAAVTIAAVSAAATATYNLIEEPSIRLGKMLTALITTSRPILLGAP